jgi:hypothetical protein
MPLNQPFVTYQNRFIIITDTVFVQPLQIYYSYKFIIMSICLSNSYWCVDEPTYSINQ